jgi:hypothetical protein
MSDVKIKIIDCTASCKMSTEMKNSKYCTGKARIVDGRIFYGCKESISGEPLEVRQFFSCELWDAGLKESCLTCPLACVNNKNKNFAQTAEERERLEKLIKELRPNMVLCGVTADQVQSISSKYTKKNSEGKRDPLGREAISAASFANDALKLILQGKRVDLAYYSLYARKASGRIKKMKKKLK